MTASDIGPRISGPNLSRLLSLHSWRIRVLGLLMSSHRNVRHFGLRWNELLNGVFIGCECEGHHSAETILRNTISRQGKGSMIPNPEAGTLTQRHNAADISRDVVDGKGFFPLSLKNHPALRCLHSLRSLPRLRRLLHRLHSPRSLGGPRSLCGGCGFGQAASRDDLLRRFLCRRHRKSSD
jgi:hypothetical protein